MSFNVSFGSQSDVRSGERKNGGRGRGPRPDKTKEDSNPRDSHPQGRGGSGGRRQHHHGHRGRRGGGGRGNTGDAAPDDDHYDDDGSGGSDGGSSTSSEMRGRGRGRGRRRDRGRGGRGKHEDGHTVGRDEKVQGDAYRGKGHHSDRGGRGGGGLQHAHSHEQISHAHHGVQPQCEHCQHHSRPSMYAAPPPCTQPPSYLPNMPPPPPYTPQPHYNQPCSHQPPVGQPNPPPINQPYPHHQPASQPYGGMPPLNQPVYAHAPPSQPPFSPSGQWPGQGFQPPGGPAAGHHLPGQPQYGHQPYSQHQPHPYASQPPPFEGTPGYNQHNVYGQTSQYGSRHNLNRPTNEAAGGEKPQPKDEGKKSKKPRKPSNKETAEGDPQQKKSEGNKPGKPKEAKPEQKEKAQKKSSPTATVDLDPDEWVKVFNLLLRKFNGRTKFGTLMTQKEDTFKGVGHDKAAQWIKENSSKFLAFEKDGSVKHVSIVFRGARMCFNYTKPGTEICKDEKCPYFHICRDFVIGNCTYGLQCGFNHSFHSKGNGKICADAGLGMFTDEQIRLIVLRSTPIVCEKYKAGCVDEACPDLHVCSKYVLDDCQSGEDCKFDHSIKESEHNKWVLHTFHMEKLPEKVLCKITIAKKETPQGAQSRKPSQGDGQGTAEKPQKSSNKPCCAMQKACSKETLLQDPQLSVPPTSESKDRDAAQTMANQESPGRTEGTLTTPKAPKQTAERPRAAEPPPAIPARRPRVGEITRTTNLEGGEGQSAFTASQYAHLCESHTWEGQCLRGYLCPRYHHRDRPPYVWQLQALGDWQAFSREDSVDIEKQFCQFANQETFEVVLDNIGGLKLSIHFDSLTASVLDAQRTGSRLSVYQNLQVRRWSTPSYVEAEAKMPLNYYTQWCWYYMDTDGHLQPFRPALFQYTLEEKYCSGQAKYYYEQGDRQLMIHLQQMVQVDLDTGVALSVFRRPIFHPATTSAPEMSSVLLKEPPPPLSHPAPPHWSKVDLSHDFELVEQEEIGSEYQDVSRSFHATLSKSRASILRIFRIQNLSLWDKYCSTKRAMTPRDGSVTDVDERRLFHGTPTLLAARGICANNMDFRRSGENVGALYGRGSYFSANALYSHSYTQGPHRYMFLAKVLVGKYKLGKESYTSPPPREGLKLYDSCVNDEANPTIFVIFDLAQSYPEYLIQYEDIGAQGQGMTKTQSLASPAASGSVVLNPQSPERNAHPSHSVDLLSWPSPPPHGLTPASNSSELRGFFDALTQVSQILAQEREARGVEERQRNPYSGHSFDNPYKVSAEASSGSCPGAGAQPGFQGWAPPTRQSGARPKKSDVEKCTLS